MSLFRFLLALLLLSCATASRAATVCVSTPAALLQAINSFNSQLDGTVLTIKVVQGTYAVGNLTALIFHDTGSRQVGLQLLGGYTTNCAGRQVNPTNTVIDGLNQSSGGLGFSLYGDANALVEGITFTRMTSDSAVLQISIEINTSDEATYRVRHCRFLGNTGQQMIFLSAPQMHIVNNLVANNTLSQFADAAVLARFTYDGDSMAVVNNNTIAHNNGSAGLLVDTHTLDSNRISEIADNILWGNSGGFDLDLSKFDTGKNVLFVNANLVGSVNGYTLAADNLRTDPRFFNPAANNFTLATNSPAINSGAPLQFYGFPTTDLGGGPRIVGSLIDRGAIESALDNFTTAVVTVTGDNGNNGAPLAGSLRAAIKNGNAASGPFRIVFNIPGSCPRTLSLAAPMLDITGDVTIDGATQPGWTPNTTPGAFDGTPCLFVNGLGNGNTPWALHVPASASQTARLVVNGMIFAGFSDAAIKLESGSNHRLWGNQFGAVGFTLPNRHAIRVTGSSGRAFIGGFDDPGVGNLIAGSEVGIYLDNTDGHSVVANNVIGFQVDGSSNGGNDIGVYAFQSPDNVILYNLVGYSGSNGITLSGAASKRNLIQYNKIGIDRRNSSAPTGGAGITILFAAGDNTIGASASTGAGGNDIRNSGGAGVWITPSGGTGNSVLSNRFLNNTGIDMDLGTAGPTPNQPSNPATGPNSLQNFPVIGQALRSEGSGMDRISGSVASGPNRTYRLDLYWSSACHPSGRGRGWLKLGSHWLVNTNGSGAGSFNSTAPLSPAPGAISATLTDNLGNTSEIGNCVVESIDDIFRSDFD